MVTKRLPFQNLVKKRPRRGLCTAVLGVGDPLHPAQGLALTESHYLCQVVGQRYLLGNDFSMLQLAGVLSTINYLLLRPIYDKNIHVHNI